MDISTVFDCSLQYTCSFCHQTGHKYIKCTDVSIQTLMETMYTAYIVNYICIMEPVYIQRKLTELTLSQLKMLAHRHGVSIASSKLQSRTYHIQRLLQTAFYMDSTSDEENLEQWKYRRPLTSEISSRFSDIPYPELDAHVNEIGQCWPTIHNAVYERVYRHFRPCTKHSLLVVELNRTDKMVLPKEYLSVPSTTVVYDNTCAVCLDTICNDKRPSVYFNCTHQFCYSCVDRYFTERNCLTCPMCRSTVHSILCSSPKVAWRIRCKYISQQQTKDDEQDIHKHLAICRNQFETEKQRSQDLERCRRVMVAQRRLVQTIASYSFVWIPPYKASAMYACSAVFVGITLVYWTNLVLHHFV